MIKHLDCPVEGPLRKQLFSDTCQSTVKQISLRRPTEVGIATTAMEFDTEGERLASTMNTIRERCRVIATEHVGSVDGKLQGGNSRGEERSWLN